MTYKEVLEYAITRGYDKVKKLPIKYKGMEVYEPYFDDGANCVGYPLSVLVDGDELRMSTPDESLEVLHIYNEYMDKQEDYGRKYDIND